MGSLNERVLEIGGAEEEEIRLGEVAATLLRRRRVVLGVLFGVLALGGLYLALRSSAYTAGVVLVPTPQQQDGRGALLGQLPMGAARFLGGGSSSSDKLIGVILGSRSLADGVVRELKSSREGADLDEVTLRTIVQEKTEIERNAIDGSVSIRVSATSPREAALIAGAFPPVINRISKEVNQSALEHKQAFLGEKLEAARERLLASEQQLADFERRRGTPEIQEQAKRTVEAAASLQQAIVEKEVELARLRRSATPDNPQLRANLAELSALRDQLRRITAGQTGGDNVLLSLRGTPELKVSTSRLVREYTKDEQVYVALTAALAESQIDVSNNLPVMTVLDSPRVPTRPSNMAAPLVMLLAAVLGLIAGVAAALLAEWVAGAGLRSGTGKLAQEWQRFKAEGGAGAPAGGRMTPGEPVGERG